MQDRIIQECIYTSSYYKIFQQYVLLWGGDGFQAPFDGEVDVTMELAECRLLLGDAPGAEAVIASPDVSPDYMAYVEARRPASPSVF